MEASERGVPADAKIRSVLGDTLFARVQFLGRVERRQVLSCMRRARAFAFPSSLETFGLVIAEAMFAGCPVVVCDAGPIPEFVEHLRTGLLVPSNDPAELAASVNRLLSDRALANALAKAGRESIQERFSIESAVRQNLDFYRSCLTGNTVTAPACSTPVMEFQP